MINRSISNPSAGTRISNVHGDAALGRFAPGNQFPFGIASSNRISEVSGENEGVTGAIGRVNGYIRALINDIAVQIEKHITNNRLLLHVAESIGDPLCG